MDLKAGEILFLDTNILLTATDEGREQYSVARFVISTASDNGIHLALSGQIVREYLVVATRGIEVNGLGLSTADALGNVEEFMGYTILYEETEEVALRLRELVREVELTGKRIHDANIAATMLSNGVTEILTQNRGDFDRFPGVRTVSLTEVSRAFAESEEN